VNGRTLTLGIAAGLAVAGLVAKRRAPRLGGLNRVVRVTAPLWIGTTRRNLLGILARGVVPSGGHSGHRTKTDSAVFLAGDPEAALLYADASSRRFDSRAILPDEPVLLKINVRGLTLLPDYDDIADNIQAYLKELSEEVGEEVKPGVPLGDLEDALYSAMDEVEARGDHGGIRGEIEDEGDDRVLALIPIHDLPIDTRAYHSFHELYVDNYNMTWNEEGSPRWPTTQYQYLGTLPTDRIAAIYLLERTARTPDLILPSYGHLVWPPQYETVDDAIDAGAKVDFLERKFHQYTVAEAKRLRK